MTMLGDTEIDHAESTKGILEDAIRALDASKDRSQQIELGVSPLGGCRKRVWLQLQGVHGENLTEPLPSTLGTAFHSAVEEGIALLDPERKRFLTEILVLDTKGYGVGKGHVDLYDVELGKVTDWKSTKKKNLRYFPKLNQRWQVQVYGLLLSEMGYDVRTVELVAVPRDGTLKEVKVHTEPFNAQLAHDALGWLTDLKSRTEEPDPEMTGIMCTDYCEFYHPTTCLGG